MSLTTLNRDDQPVAKLVAEMLERARDRGVDPLRFATIGASTLLRMLFEVTGPDPTIEFVRSVLHDMTLERAKDRQAKGPLK